MGRVPLISIITINYNRREDLRLTIDSVAAQRGGDFEYVVVDGGSTDGSAALVEQRSDVVTRHVSERDQGIYDAMNKGVRMATGTWVIFMNSGDVFADPDVLSDMSALLRTSEADIVYGDALVSYADGYRRPRLGQPPEELPFGMICSHQSVFARKQFLLERPFPVKSKYGIPVSDFEFLISSWCAGRLFHYTARTICIVSAGGYSDVNRMSMLLQTADVVRRQGRLTPLVRLSYVYQIIRAVSAQAVKTVIPPFLTIRLRRLLRN